MAERNYGCGKPERLSPLDTRPDTTERGKHTVTLLPPKVTREMFARMHPSLREAVDKSYEDASHAYWLGEKRL